MGTNYKDHTDKPLADLNLDYQNIEKMTHNLNEHSIRHASTLIKTRYAPRYNLNNSQGVGLGATANNPPDPHWFFFLVCLRGGWLPGVGTYVTPSLNHAGCVITTSGVFSCLFLETVLLGNHASILKKQ
jgi:hypothetical protein